MLRSASSDQANSLGFVGMDAKNTPYLDLRGVGDTGYAENARTLYPERIPSTDKPPQYAPNADYSGKATPNELGKALDRFDPTGRFYRGDINYANWETAVGEFCKEFSEEHNSYLFLTHPDAMRDAFVKGFSIFGLAHNHTFDCFNGGGRDPKQRNMDKAKQSATLLTFNSIETLKNQLSSKKLISDGKPFLWSGISHPELNQVKKSDPRVGIYQVKGKRLRVAFNNVYFARKADKPCGNAHCDEDLNEIMLGLANAEADVRILSLHCREQGDYWKEIDEVGKVFIEKYKGDVVFGAGPHKWRPVRISEQGTVDGKKTGKKGVVFASLGNFIHPGMDLPPNYQPPTEGISHPLDSNFWHVDKNAIARVLIDPITFRIAQVQLVQVNIDADRATFGVLKPSTMGSADNQVLWQETIIPTGRENEKATVSYFNVD